MKTIFMTGGGGAGTIAAAKFFKKSGKYKIILGDMNKWAAGLTFADKSYVLPAAVDDSFIDTIKSIIIKEKVDVFIPLVDEEILKTYTLKDEFPGLMILLPTCDFAKMALDKWLLIKKFQEYELPFPKTYLAIEEPHGLSYPFIVKPRTGRGSRNVACLESPEQLSAYKMLFNLACDKILLQEKIEGKEFTVSVVVDKNNCLLAVVPKEIIYKKGVTIAAVTRKNEAIYKLCCEITTKLKPKGPFNVQLILRSDGVPMVFEINPRYSTTIALTMEAGVNEIELLLHEQLRGNRPAVFTENLVMSRFYEQIYFKE